MYEVTVRPGLTHGLQTPIRRSRPGKFQDFLVRIFERPVGGLAAKRFAANLYKLSAHLVTSSCRARVAIHLARGEQDRAIDRGLE
jgi:hypothetical protein